MKIIDTKRCGYCDRCEKLVTHCFIVKGIFLKHSWCYRCLMENAHRISNLELR
jgi:hypothetical protein